ncbi:Glycoside hydrolase 131 catalytic N-terminal domain-containing protein [Plasmodiophora brassicae]
MMQSHGRQLNLSHEYQLVFVEAQGGTHVFEIKYGAAYRNASSAASVDVDTANRLRLMSSTTNGFDKAKVLLETPLTPGVFHNFAVTIDWERATPMAYCSQGNLPLELVVPTTANAVGHPCTEFHVGIVKLPVGPMNSVVFDEFQERDIHESLVYGGVFAEDSTAGIVPLPPF